MENTVTKAQIEVNEQILATKNVKGGSIMFVARITEAREKAVKVDYAIEPIWASGNHGVTIYTYSIWIPVSIIFHDKLGGLTIKKWFLNKGLEKAHYIKNYFLTDTGVKAFV